MSRGQGERGRAECGGCGCGEKLARQLCMPQNWKSWPDCASVQSGQWRASSTLRVSSLPPTSASSCLVTVASSPQ